MVLKKSEYALNYRVLQKDMNERKQIWQDNIKCRESLRSLNRADHYWSFQLSEESMYDNDADLDGEQYSVPHKLKHRDLLAKYSSNKSRKIDGLLWSNDGNVLAKKPHSDVNDMNKTFIETTPVQGQEVAVQTPNWLTDNSLYDSSQELKELERNMSQNTISDKVTPFRPSSPIPVGNTTTESNPPLTVADLIPDHPVTAGSHSPRARRLAWSSNNSKSHCVLSRTSRRAYSAEKISPFASYGWNNEVKSMGAKKTFNVSAPERQVYESAVLTKLRRHEEVRRYLEEEEAARKLVVPRSSMVVNHSSIWRSEYQDRFTPERSSKRYRKGKYARAKSATAVRPVSKVEWYRENG